MIDQETSKELLNEAKALTPEVYKDIAKPVLKEVGSVAGRTAKALLFPLRGMLWGWEQIEKLVEEGVKKKFEKIPEERRKTPEPEIAVPLLQALTYTAQNEMLREMYLNLLANSMDIGKDNVVHPSFVQLIKQMNSLDAKVFDKLSISYEYQRIINPTISVKNEKKFFINATPQWYIGWTIDGYNEFDVSASLVRLSKFGLIEFMYERTVGGKEGYDFLKKTKFLIDTLNRYKNSNPKIELEIHGTESIVYVNEYGKQFKFACLK